MPLIKGKSPESFSKNVSTEMHEGKPLKQSLAIAYAMKKKANKANGGEMLEHCSQCGYAHKEGAHQYADGGHVKGVHEPIKAITDDDPSIGEEARGVSHAGILTRQGQGYPKKEEQERGYYADAKKGHKRVLSEMKSMRKDRKYLADGGDVNPSPSPSPDSKNSLYDTMASSIKHAFMGADEPVAAAPKEESHDTNPLSAGMKKAFHKPGYADGGFIREEKASGYEAMPHPHDVEDHEAMMLDDRDLNQHGALERGPEGHEDGSDPGERMVSHAVENQSHDGDDMVGHIMKKRQMKFAHGGHAMNDGSDMIGSIMHKRKMMSKGGQVANDVGMGASADLEDNQFDDLVLRDDLEEHYTGANSGDEIGNHGEDERRKDIVSKIMASRRKKDRLPRPA